MRFQGGKSRQAKLIASKILPFLKPEIVYYEPFVGGANVLYEMASHPHIEASDNLEDLILMYQALQKGWIPPDFISEEEYKKLKGSEPSALRGFAGLVGSWGGKFFDGYARGEQRNYIAEGKKGLLKYFKRFQHVNFRWLDYQELEIKENSVVYCDPPYIKTTKYRKEAFNHNEFWKWVFEIGEHSLVFVTEFEAPYEMEPIFSWGRVVKEGIYTSRFDKETLFVYGKEPE